MPILQTAAELTVSSEGTCTWTSVHCTAIVKPCVCSRIRRLCMNSRADQNDWREILSRLVAGPISHFPRIAVLAAHPDHDAAALVARMALAQLHPKSAPLILEMTSYHARQGQCVTGEFLQPNDADEICFELTEEDRQRKRKMFDSYASQRFVLSAFDL